MTERLAAACARHAWATLAAWLLVLVASVAAIVVVLTGFTTEGAPTNDPQSERADDRFARAFAPSSANDVSDVVVVRSTDAAVADPRFRQFVVRLARAIEEPSGRVTARSYYDARSSRLVSDDGHAAAIVLSVPDDDLADAVIAEVERADGADGFSVAITGETTRNHDFNELSERDLQHGELEFGLPAALIVLLLVFGAVVAGVIPLVMAIFAIVAAMGLVALISQAFELSVFTVNTGEMGVAEAAASSWGAEGDADVGGRRDGRHGDGDADGRARSGLDRQHPGDAGGKRDEDRRGVDVRLRCGNLPEGETCGQQIEDVEEKRDRDSQGAGESPAGAA
jgi:uncharacterized membrane protein YdfJ with MMPL/SSD domain